MTVRYQARNGDGVLDTTTGRVVLPWMPEFQAYLAWIAQGNTPDDPPPAPAPAPDRSYYLDAGELRRARQDAKLTDEAFLTQLRKGSTP